MPRLLTSLVDRAPVVSGALVVTLLSGGCSYENCI
jgi:hypothetical protein